MQTRLMRFLIKFLSQSVEHLGCYARYSDGKTNRKWMPLGTVKL